MPALGRAPFRLFPREKVMPCTYVIDKERGLVISTGLGRVTFVEMQDHQDQLVKDPDFNPEFNQLIDATAVTEVELSRDTAQDLASRKVFSSTSRRALVATKPAVFGMGRVLMAYVETSDSPSVTNVFYELAPALKWLEGESAYLPLRSEDIRNAI